MSALRIIISGGGTGGHIFPAIAIANSIRELQPTADILFVGADGRMEMEKVPLAGYPIKGLPVAGIQRRLTLRNLAVPFKLLKSLRMARTIIREFQPQVVIGVGGYASGPVLRVATQEGIPTLIQEQNSYPGLTNKILGRKAQRICVAYEGMEKWFNPEKIRLTGNPVRREMANTQDKAAEALTAFQLDDSRPVLLVVGGSLGARAINEAVMIHADRWLTSGLQVIWQTGKHFEAQAIDFASTRPGLHVHAFISAMNLAYSAADLIVSRAGAMAISELCLVGKAVVFIPSPHVAEDHQTKNALALTRADAAILVKDQEASETLGEVVIGLQNDHSRRKELGRRIRELARPNASLDIAREVISLAEKAS